MKYDDPIYRGSNEKLRETIRALKRENQMWRFLLRDQMIKSQDQLSSLEDLIHVMRSNKDILQSTIREIMFDECKTNEPRFYDKK